MKLSAKKMGSMKAVKESLKKGANSGFKQYIKNIPADGISVRFLTEPEEWFGYQEYWDESARTFVPMVEGEILPDGAKASFRYLANALDVENDRVIPLKLAKTVANVLILKYDKYDTMMDRNYDCQKHGEGLDTTYDVTPDAPSKMNLTKYDLLDLDKVLSDARAEATGDRADAPEEEDEPTVVATKVITSKPTKSVTPLSKKVSTGSATASVEEVEVVVDEPSYSNDELYPDGEFRTDYTQNELSFISNADDTQFTDLCSWWDESGYSITATKHTIDQILEILQHQTDYNLESELEDEESVEEDDDEGIDDEDDDEVEYSEDDLRAMSLKELKLIATDMGIDITGSNTVGKIVDLIIEESEV